MANQHWLRRKRLPDKMSGIPYHKGLELNTGANNMVPTMPYTHFSYQPFGGGTPNHMQINALQGATFDATFGKPTLTVNGLVAGQIITQVPSISETQYDTNTGIG